MTQHQQCMRTLECHFLILKAQITLMRTSPGPGGSTFTVVTCKGFFASHATAALHSMTCKHS